LTNFKKIFLNRSTQIQKYKFARILFLADIADNKEYMTDKKITEGVGTSHSTVRRTRKNYAEKIHLVIHDSPLYNCSLRFLFIILLVD